MERISAKVRGELLRMLDGTGIGQGDIAAWMEMDEGYLSRVLSGKKPLPEGFLDNWRAAIPAITQERHEAALAAVSEVPAAV